MAASRSAFGSSTFPMGSLATSACSSPGRKTAWKHSGSNHGGNNCSEDFVESRLVPLASYRGPTSQKSSVVDQIQKRGDGCDSEKDSHCESEVRNVRLDPGPGSR